MNNKKSKSFNHQVFEKSYKRLNLSATQRTVFQRLLGFLIRNDRPFPYSAVAMANLTGYDKRTIFRSLEALERYRLIERIGFGKNRKFKRGSILIKILTTVSNRIKNELTNNLTTVTLCHKNLINRDIVSPNKTSSSLKHNKSSFFSDPIYNEYVSKIRGDIKLNLMPQNTGWLSYEDWLLTQSHGNIVQ